MFAKPYKLKSNNTLKNSEKKHLAQRVQDEFPEISQEKIKELIPVKSSCSCMKLILHSQETVGVYVVDGVPVFIETERLIPTVCALWRVPEMLPTVTVHTPVLQKVLGGAPLYLPGVTLPHGGIGFPQFQRGALVAACTSDNAAAAIIGKAVLSSGDMLLRAAGSCLEAIHVYGDQLCKDLKFGRIERPKMGCPTYGDNLIDGLADDINQLSVQPSRKEEWPSLVKQNAVPPAVPNEPKLIQEAPPTEAGGNEIEEDLDDTTITECSHMEQEDGIPADMDGLLKWCLLSFLKVEGKHVELPLKTNLLYKNHLMPLCPPDRSLDVKKSSYKKMGKFLDAMQQEGLVEVREIEKGVDALVAVNLAHEQVHAHSVPAELRERAERAERSERAERDLQYTPPLVREVYCVTAAVAPLLAEHKKGTPLPATEVRSALAEHVRARGLQSTLRRGHVRLDALLATALGRQETEEVKWEDLMNGVVGKMTASTEMRFADGSVRLAKSRLEPVRMQVASRSGNKKVTLVSNLESFGFSLPALSQAWQAAAAAACCVTRSPGSRHDQLMLQGDQTHFVAKMLIETYGLPKKYVEGADKALKKKK